MLIRELKRQTGSMLVVSLVATGLFLILLLGGITLALLQQKLIAQRIAKAQALHIAESGVNYYRWVLYHDHEEYCNKELCITTPPYGPYGPYSYQDFSNNITGEYVLYITPPPPNGSTIVDVTAVGWTTDHPNIKRTISVKCGIPSWSSFSTLANAEMRFGAGTEVWGPIHSNGGIRFDGIAHNTITSSVLNYDDTDHAGGTEFGVHTHVHGNPDASELCNEATPPCNPAPNAYSDVFLAGRSFPEPVISFDLLDSYINEALSKATAKGIVLPASSGEGYHITLNTDDTIDIKTVNTITDQCRWGGGPANRSDTYGIVTETDYLIGTTTPVNGVIFVKDHVWVDGQIDGNRVTILAFDEPITGTVSDILINNNLLYTNYDGTDAIGLIAQRNVSIGMYSLNDLRVDAAMIAKEGRIGRNYYYCSDNNGCSNTYCKRNSITVYGSLATRNRYGFNWLCSGVYCSGYATRNLIYDSSLTFAPPPHYPTTGEYTFISWDEN